MDTKSPSIAANSPVSCPHIGQMVRQRISAKGVSIASVARKLGVAPVGVSRYCDNPSIQSGILWNVGLALEHNFFAELAEAFPHRGHDRELAERDARIAELEKELAIYKEIVMAGKGG